MAADLNTSIILKGTKEELKVALGSMMKLTTTKNFHLDCFENEEALVKKIESSDGEVEFYFGGPYGHFASLEETDIFEQIISAAPNIYLNGKIEGFTTGQSEAAVAETKEGKLYLKYFVLFDEDDYVNMVEETLPFEEFCSVFGLDEDETDIDQYYELIGDDELLSLDYEKFCNLFEAEETSEEDFADGIEKIKGLGISDRETYEADFWGDEIVFDPVTKEYIQP